MITLEMGQLYGMNSEKELMQTIKELRIFKFQCVYEIL